MAGVGPASLSLAQLVVAWPLVTSSQPENRMLGSEAHNCSA